MGIVIEFFFLGLVSAAIGVLLARWYYRRSSHPWDDILNVVIRNLDEPEAQRTKMKAGETISVHMNGKPIMEMRCVNALLLELKLLGFPGGVIQTPKKNRVVEI